MCFRRFLPTWPRPARSLRSAPSLRAVALLVIAMGVLLTACGDAEADDVVTGGAGDSNRQDASPREEDPDPADRSTAPGPDWQRVEATADLVAPNVVTSDEVVADPDDPYGVLVRFFGGVPECYGARATVTEETDEVVRIRLETGGRPGAEDEMCITIAVTQELKVTLDEPVGDRDLVAVGI